jgi:hypothetical protein
VTGYRINGLLFTSKAYLGASIQQSVVLGLKILYHLGYLPQSS